MTYLVSATAFAQPQGTNGVIIPGTVIPNQVGPQGTVLPDGTIIPNGAVVPQGTVLPPPTNLQSVPPVASRTTKKVPTPPSNGSVSSNKAASSTSEPRGYTYVRLASGLERINRGLPPESLKELKLLEAQQSQVAKKIDQVTVNVQQGAAQGSGVIITPDGYVLTAAHVAGNKDREAWLYLSNGTRVKARTLGMNRNKDAGLLKIEEGQRSTPWPFATLGRSRNLDIGQWVIAAGHPGGWDAARGSVVRVGRVLKMRFESKNREKRVAHTLWTDCPLIGGDSGGPLFTLKGELVGIHSRIGTEVEDNMHVPIDVFDESWDRMANSEVWGTLPGYTPIIGINGPEKDDVPIIEGIVPSGPAARAGLAVGDIVRTIDGVRITTFSEIIMAVEARMPGDVMTLTIKRGESFLRVQVVVGVKER